MRTTVAAVLLGLLWATAGGAAWSREAVVFDIYENTDNAHLMSKTQGLQPRPGAIDLGPAASPSACQETCVARLGADPTTGCTSFTFYHRGYNTTNDSRAGRCFGDRTGFWAPVYSTCAAIP